MCTDDPRRHIDSYCYICVNDAQKGDQRVAF